MVAKDLCDQCDDAALQEGVLQPCVVHACEYTSGYTKVGNLIESLEFSVPSECFKNQMRFIEEVN